MESTKNRIIEVVRELRSKGETQAARVLNERLHNDEPIYDDDLNVLLGLAVKGKGEASPELAPVISLPPRTGKGSSKKRWLEVLFATTSVEKEVGEAWTRDDIVEFLAAGGVIPPE